MNRDEWEKHLLLAESGELSESDRRTLDARLAADPAAAAWRGDLRRLTALAGEALPANGPSLAVMSRIRAEAESCTRRPAAFGVPATWRWGLAYAAALALIVGSWVWHQPSSDGDRIAQIHAIAAMTGTEPAAATPIPAEGDQGERLRALAQELLKMEGLALDELSAADIQAGESTTTDYKSAPSAAAEQPSGSVA
ncbi:MAG: hypothetical protein K8T26_14310 [Lentisphaerae bacterium]|nr:hypothetical protein [Lentisphaerota bacterium]